MQPPVSYLIVYSHHYTRCQVETDFRPVQKIPETLPQPMLYHLSGEREGGRGGREEGKEGGR